MRPGYQAYLAQFRALSNMFWASYTERNLEQFRERGVGGATWANGTCWKAGMSQAEIDQAEEIFGAPFPAEYRAFLAILNAPNKAAHWFLFDGDELKPAPPRNIFTDWSQGLADVDRKEADLISGILFDVEKGAIWHDYWGERPNSEADRAAHIRGLVQSAPRLIPLHSHRFLVSGLDLEPTPVLSVMQSDVIYYSDCIEDCLAADFPDLAPGLETPDFTLQDKRCFDALAAVPFWGPLMT